MAAAPVESEQFLQTVAGRVVDGVALGDSLKFDGMHAPVPIVGRGNTYESTEREGSTVKCREAESDERATANSSLTTRRHADRRHAAVNAAVCSEPSSLFVAVHRPPRLRSLRTVAWRIGLTASRWK